jgi:hypothetical protein
MCLEAFFPPSPGAVHRNPSVNNSNFVTPVNDTFFYRSRFHPTSSAGRNHTTPSPLLQRKQEDIAQSSLCDSPMHETSQYPVRLADDEHLGGDHDPFPCDLSSSLTDMDSVAWNGDPMPNNLHGLDVKPASAQNEPSSRDEVVARGLISRLDSFHEHARDSILSAPEPEQALLTNAYANWALHVARDPLGGNDMRPDKDLSEAFQVGPSATV